MKDEEDVNGSKGFVCRERRGEERLTVSIWAIKCTKCTGTDTVLGTRIKKIFRLQLTYTLGNKGLGSNQNHLLWKNPF